MIDTTDTLESRIIASLANPTACRALRALCYFSRNGDRKGQCSAKVSSSDIARHISCSVVDTEEALLELSQANLVTFSGAELCWALVDNNNIQPLIDQQIRNYETALIRGRCMTTNYHAAEKIKAIDELASQIAAARLDVRS